MLKAKKFSTTNVDALRTRSICKWNKNKKDDTIRDSGKNGQILVLTKIFSNVPLFWKYLGKYHFFGTRVIQTQVP